MENIALYRKYRPVCFEEMVGQKEIKVILTNAIKNNMISHAYLFSGPRGTGKTTTAKIFAKMINCTNLIDYKPCGKCKSCVHFYDTTDIIEIDAASNNGVDEIRELRDNVNLSPSLCKYRVYIIDEVHMLTIQAFNALLKTLEEPPKHAIFILATTEYHKIPTTILSRCQKLQFNKVSIDDIVLKLQEISLNEKIKIEDNALIEIAKLSDGGMRDSVNYLDQLRTYKSSDINIDDVYSVCGNISSYDICNLISYMKNNDMDKMVSYIEKCSSEGKNFERLLDFIIEYLKDCVLLTKNVDRKYIKTNFEIIDDTLKLVNIDDLYFILNFLTDLCDKMRNVSNQNLFLLTNLLILGNKLKSESVNEDDNKMLINNTVNKQNVIEDVSLKNESNNKLKDNYNEKNELIVNQKIVDDIINNVLATANKKNKEMLIEKMKKLDLYFTDNEYSGVSSYFYDINIEVVGNENIIFSCNYNSVINNIYNNYSLCSDFISEIFGKKYIFVVISTEQWLKIKDKYIFDIKNNVKYFEKKVNINDLFYDNCDKIDVINVNDSIKKLKEIVGEELIKYK